ncbi:D-methionine transport system substrate-binding protein [Carboxydocella sporoproducens DSM 16521]|uniref:Lipoprotein n=2 Tax=Carboxydocella TaxID=178898 RepID=A0A1T4MX85_9FIRM|nr:MULTISPECIES: MetQ/NlpA family ABC transporter substrate-binding protein [Carboxydocella]AVX20288.1 D-methionine transport system substrate-binding protein [Carboxydocella thermautotrophica]AVX30712.1 D-methionine transport system substrate-binding protein [Carboxydocella thermautotrophica]GAW30140.1 ABC transporter substrate-binding protein [Carboxydocella sp. ULO1]SJZ71583.1 D-methionine transport system substrate-binding protein [Carboxydocella sporoproducens DSM 16521]
MFKRKALTLITGLALLAGLISGCGGQQEKAAEQPAAKETVVLKVGATPVPHKEILEAAKPLLEKKGIKLEIVEFTDYILPNKALANGELDANYFQHVPYLEDFSKENKLDLTYTVKVHFEPMGIYPGKVKDLAQLPEKAKIAVPNDPTNEARALLLLEKAGLIKVKPGVGLKATKQDIIENPKQLEIQELDAAQIPRSLPDVDLAVINGNYAVEAGLNAGKDALVSEDKNSEAAQTFGNIIAVRKGDENKEAIKALGEVLLSPEIKKFIEEKYQGAVLPL